MKKNEWVLYQKCALREDGRIVYGGIVHKNIDHVREYSLFNPDCFEAVWIDKIYMERYIPEKHDHKREKVEIIK